MEIDFSRVSLEPSLQYVCVCLGMKVECGRKYSLSFSLCLFCECVGFCYTSSLHQKYIGSSRLFIILVDSLTH